MWFFARQPYSSHDEQIVMEAPGQRAAGIAGARRAAYMYPNQRAELPRGVNYLLPRQPYQWATSDRMLAPNQRAGDPPNPRGSEVLAQQAAMTAAMTGKLGGP